jgi:diguanylate cyclase (GGDEF)-like protein/PAS domain S-box-containing protein
MHLALANSVVSAALIRPCPALARPAAFVFAHFERFLPGNRCIDCDPNSLMLSAASDMLIALSYFAVSVCLLYASVRWGRLIPWRGAPLLFAALLLGAGLARAVGLYSLWNPASIDLPEPEIALIKAVLAALTAGAAWLMLRPVRAFLVRVQQHRKIEVGFLEAAENSLDALYLLRSVQSADGEIVDFQFTYLNRNGEMLIGLPREKILGSNLCELLPMNRSSGFFEDYRRVATTGDPVVHQFSIAPGEEQPRWIRHQIVRVEDGIAITAADITEHKKAEERAQYSAQHDVLTGLANRSLLNDRLERAIERADRYQQKVGVFLIDLDEFKQINDTLGHAAGDVALITVGQRLRENVRATDSVLRLSGDEFLVVMPDVSEDADILRMAAKLVSAIARQGPQGLESVALSCSLGIAIYPTLAQSPEELLTRADAAMYRAKSRGGSCYEVFARMSMESYSHPKAWTPPVVLPRGKPAGVPDWPRS